MSSSGILLVEVNIAKAYLLYMINHHYSLHFLAFRHFGNRFSPSTCTNVEGSPLLNFPLTAVSYSTDRPSFAKPKFHVQIYLNCLRNSEILVGEFF